MKKNIKVTQKNQESTTLLLQHLISVTDEFMKIKDQKLDYKKLVDVFVELCSAKFAVFNLFDADGENFTTVALSGTPLLLDKVTKHLGFNIIGKKWETNPQYLDRIKNDKVTEFQDLHEIVGDSLPRIGIDLIASFFNVGQVYVFLIERDKRILGEFTVFLEKGDVLTNWDMVELFTSQVGLLLSRYLSEHELKKEQLIIYSILKSMKDILVMTDSEGLIGFVNSSVKDMIINGGENLVGQSIFDALSLFSITEDMPLYRDYKKIYREHRLLKVEEKTMEVNRNGGQVFVEYSLTPIEDKNVGKLGYLLLMRDKTLKHLEQTHIEYLSNHDQLTALHNRRYFEKSIVSHNHPDKYPLTIIMGDVNGLKLVNDSFGHAIGDELLVTAANLMKQFMRPEDVLARIGGDEFVMILPKTSKGKGLSLISKIQEEADTMTIHNTRLSISLGLATKTSEGDSIGEVIRDAEEDMYKHKLFESSSVHSKTIDMVMKSLFEKNYREMRHSQRVSELCREIAQAMGYSEESTDRVSVAGLMHDIGKIAIPQEILNKTTELNAEEYNILKKHSEIGYRILISVNEFSDISKYVLEHHERMDGKGYPKGLKGDEIHPLAKIISVADAFDTLTNEISYGQTLDIEQAIVELERHTGTQFDEKVVKALKVLYHP